MIGDEGLELYNTFKYEDEGDRYKFDNVTYERHLFFTRTQQAEEAIDQYATELKGRAKSCEFGELKEGLIRDRIVCDIGSNLLREKLLRTQDLTLDKALQLSRANETSKAQMKTITEGQETVAFLGKQKAPQ